MVFKYDEELPIVLLILITYAAVCFLLTIRVRCALSALSAPFAPRGPELCGMCAHFAFCG
eukprot:6183074-Pleurochrysis_carterae.AAC.1